MEEVDLLVRNKFCLILLRVRMVERHGHILSSCRTYVSTVLIYFVNTLVIKKKGYSH